MPSRASGHPPAPAASVAAEPGPFGDLAPLASGTPFVALPLADAGRSAVVSLPLGARDPRPLLVATHGAGGNPETHCRLWRRVVGDRGFVLCVRGTPIYPSGKPVDEPRFFYPGHPWLAGALGEAIAALARRFGPYLDARAPVFAGYSQGASMGALLLPDHPAGFGRAVLVEGGFGEGQEWNVAVAERLRAHGGERVLFVCGRARCAALAQAAAGYLRRAGLGARVEHAVGAGHTHEGAVEQLIREGFDWLVDGDPRWPVPGGPPPLPAAPGQQPAGG